MSGRSQHERDGSCCHRRVDKLRSTKSKSDMPTRVEKLCSWLYIRGLLSCSMLYTLSPNALADIPLVLLLDIHYSLPNSLLLALSHGTHQNVRSIPRPGCTAKPPRRATHRQRQAGPEASPSRDREKLRTRSRALAGVS